MKYNKLILSLFITLLVTPLVAAFGVTAPNWEDNPLIIEPGETVNTALILQNMVGDQDITLIAEIIEGNEIAKITDSSLEYLVPSGRKDINVNLEVTIPAETALGTEYNLIVSFKESADDEGKMIQMATGIEKPIPILVQEKEVEELIEEPETDNVMITTISAIVLVLIILLYLVLSRKKKKK